MARNGSGTYSLPAGGSWYPAVNAVSATVADWNTLISDVASALTGSVAADGQTVMSGNLNFNSSYRPYNVANASATGHPVVYGQGSWSLGAGTITGALSGTSATFSSTLGVTGTSTFTGAATFTVAPVFTDASGSRTALGAAASGVATGSGLTMATSRLLGRTTAGTGALEEISVSGATLSGGTLTVYAGPTLLATQASTSGTAITFTGIPSTAKRVTINLSGVSTSGTSIVCLRIGSGSIDSSGYLGSSAIGGTTVTNNTTYFGVEDGTNAAAVRHGVLVLTLVDASTNTWAMQGSVGRSDTTTYTVSAGSKSLSGVLDRVSITTVGGADTFDAGKINVMYE